VFGLDLEKTLQRVHAIGLTIDQLEDHPQPEAPVQMDVRIAAPAQGSVAQQSWPIGPGSVSGASKPTLRLTRGFHGGAA
jgi:hypothetical protein